MKLKKIDLGKITLTSDGLWSKGKSYERISMVHDGLYSSYISKKYVPVGIELGNPNYWQPVASLKEDFRTELITVRKEIIDIVATVTNNMKNSRLVVANKEERDSLNYKQISVGCEVYELDTKNTFILDIIIPETNAKNWHMESNGLNHINFIVVPYNGNKEDTRLSIPLKGRFQNLIISYIDNINKISYTERYLNKVFDDANWKSNTNWKSIFID